jgi:hypothetical protein
MNLKRIAVTAAMSGALGLAAIGVGAGTAQADDRGYGCWPFPCDTFQGPPGQNPFGPPGQVKKQEFLPGPWGFPVPNPVEGVAPGHWDEVPLGKPPWWHR